MTDCRIMIMAGGTGGHVFPALAVAETLRRRGAEVVWLGTRSGLEADKVPAAGFAIEWVRVSGLRGKGLRRKLQAPFMILLALSQSLRALRRVRPHAVLGMGGFVSGPGGVAARLLRLPLLIHEQNAVAGLTNRLLSRIASTSLQAFPGALPERAGPVVVGNPVRAEIAALPGPAERLAGRRGRLRLLVLGGSLGARAINELMPRVLESLAEQAPELWHQTGGRHLEQTREDYARHGLADAVRLDAFIEDMAAAYAWADLVLCRAGALTVAELAAAGVASVLVPYPHAVDDHQTLNADYLARAGAAWLISQHELRAGTLAELLQSLQQDRSRLLDMAVRARSLAHPRATAEVAGHCLAACDGMQGGTER